MKNTLLIALLLMAQLFFPEVIKAEIKLPAVISSNMVLQRDTQVQLWGWTEPNTQVKIKTSWLEESLTTTSDNSGKWLIQVKTTLSKDAQTITFKDSNSELVLDNILFGEVWFCTGQSNMEQPLRGFTGQPTFGGTQAILKSRNPNLRWFKTERDGTKAPQTELKGHSPWQESTPQSIGELSAVAYFFGAQLQETLDVPVGIIQSSFGGSQVQSWMSKEALSEHQEVDLATIETINPRRTPTTIFNAMIHPLIPYTIKGALWYQGESNRHEPEVYKQLFPAMVKDWRSKWNQGDFPFYYVQIAPYSYAKHKDAFNTVENTAFMREVQMQCVDLIPNSGIAVTTDLGAESSIHPPKKKEVAQRLLFHALHQSYGFKKIDCFSPVFESLEVKDGGLLLKFKHAEKGVFTYDKLEGFEIAGDDHVFYPATAIIVDRKDVLVKSDKVKKPVAVRYAWGNYVHGTLFDNNLLPASSFRTDNWDDAKRAEK